MRARRLLKPTVLGMRPSTLLYAYRWRLRHHLVQELLAGAGIAVGVALIFGVLVANVNFTGPAAQLIHGVTGTARLKLSARSEAGFDEAIAKRVQALPGVDIASPVLRGNVTVVGPTGRSSIELVGVTGNLVSLRGPATRNFGAGTLLLTGGLGLSSTVAHAIGAQAGERVRLFVRGDTRPALVRAVLNASAIGTLQNTPVAVALMPIAQQLLGRPKRVSDIMIVPEPGTQERVRRELQRVAAGRLDVTDADSELQVLNRTAQPITQSTSLFAAIGGMVGFLLAMNAMLLTMPERRRSVAEMRSQGFSPRQVMLILAFQALTLGVIASLFGLLLGVALARTVFSQTPVYLEVAFPIGVHQEIHAGMVAVALACGVLAALLASLPPILDMRRGRPVDAVLHEPGEPGQRITRRATMILGLVGVMIVVIVTVFVVAVPSLTILGGIMLAIATLCLIPVVFVALMRLLKSLSARVRGSMLAVAVIELDATAARSTALIGVAALAVFGSVAIQGARHDLIGGLDSAIAEYLDTADLWVTTNDNFLTVNSFRAGATQTQIASLPAVASVRSYQGGLLDVGTRRLWIRARPAGDHNMIQASQLLAGNLAHATLLLRRGGWAVVSQAFANENHLRVGATFALPTPSGPARFGIAGITTNTGWAPGAITLNAADYARYWQSTDPAALEVDLRPGVTPARGRREVQRAIAARAGLRVETTAEREAKFKSSAREGMRSLSQISLMLLITAALAVASALSAAIWQRRARLASLKAQGFDTRQLWRALLLESAIVLGVGCADGAILGFYGHALASRWLRLNTGFPAAFTLGEVQVLLALVVVLGISLGVIAIPGLSAARISARASFQE